MKTGWEISNFENEFMFQEGPGVRNWQFTETGIKLLNVANIEKTGFLNLAKTSRHLSFEEVESKYKHFLCDAGDLVIASSGISFDSDGYLRTRGVFIENEHLPLCLNTSTIRFKSKNNNSLFFLKHWLQSTEFRKQITRLVTGSAQQNFGPSHLKQIKIKIPPISEQKRIAAILDKADEIRRNREQAITKLEQLAQSIFVEMFGNPVTNNKGWDETKKLSDVADIVSGITKGRKISNTFVRDVPYLAVLNVQDKHLNLSVVKTIQASTTEINRYLIKKNDLLLTEGGDPDKLGRGTLWNNELPECIHQNHIFRVRLIEDDLSPRFLNWLIGSARGKKYFLKSAKQTTGIASINMTQLKSFPLIIPPIALQEEFAKRINQIEKLKADNTKALANHNALFASLQQQAFSGNL